MDLSSTVNEVFRRDRVAAGESVCLADPQEPEEVRADRVVIAGVPIDNLTMSEAMDAIEAFIAEGRPRTVVTPNVDHIVRIQKDAAFREAYEGASLVLADGMPLVWLSHLSGRGLKEKVSGSDLFPLFCERAAANGHRLYFMGGRPGAAQAAADILKDRHAGLQVVGIDCPPMGFEKDPAANAMVIQRIRDARPDVLFVGLGTPKGELWIHRYHTDCEVPVSIGIGGSFDLVAGIVRRAPRVLQRLGMEWCWRLMLEPRRLFRRYVVDDLPFLQLAWSDIRAARAQMRACQSGAAE